MPPVPEGDQALDDLVARAAGVGPGVQERLDAVAAVGGHHDRLVETDRGGQREQGEVADAHAGEEQHGAADQHQRRGRAQIGLDEDQEREPAHQQEGREQRRQELVDRVALAFEVVGEKQDDRELRQLGRLERQPAQADPAVHVVHRRQEEDDDQQQRAGDHDRVDHHRPAQLAVVDPHHRDHHREAHHGPQRLADEEVIGAAVALLSQRGGGAPHHDQPEAQQRHGHRGERRVGRELLRHYLLAFAIRSRTSALNARPRSA